MAEKMVKKAEPSHRDTMRQSMLVAAISIVETQGYDKLSLRNLAQALSISVGTIYNYFTDINDLTLHINSQTVVMLDAALTRSVTARTKNVPRYFDFLERHPERWRALFLHYPPKDFELPQWYLDTVGHIVKHVRDLLLPYMAGYSEREARDITIGLWATLHGLSMLDQQGKLTTVSGDRSARKIAQATVSKALHQNTAQDRQTI
jgi:AcrR family transcriptional regulator